MRRLLGRLLLALIVLLLLALMGAYLMLRGSLPQLKGEIPLAGLQAPATIARDALGVVTIEAASKDDAMRALGYVHAQERYFEMDLMRRAAAGELSELVGSAALPMDRRIRIHRLRARVRQHLQAALGHQRDAVEAYRAGVNAGLADLDVRPWPYLLLRQSPNSWSAEDTILVGLAMYGDLQDAQNRRELSLYRLQQVLPPALYALLAHDGSEWDAPLRGDATGNTALPDTAALDLRMLATSASLTPPPAPRAAHLSPAAPERDVGEPPLAAVDSVVGSNNFAVDGTLTADGRAILADDMHLSLRAPNIWFRVRLRYPDARAPGGQVDVTGFSLPGVPAVIVGSNRHVAWGFTNSYIDTADFMRIPASQLTAAKTAHHVETIHVAGGSDETLQVDETAWGPIVATEPDGSALALRWTAQLPGAIQLDFADMATAADIDQAQAIADHAGVPAQNLLLADSDGRIGWRLVGARPDRAPGCLPDALLQPDHDASGHCPPWSLRSDAAPALIDPPQHRLWTANSRVVDLATLAVVGDGGYDLGARAHQIRDDLFAHPQFDENALLKIQLDDRALLIERWWKLLRGTLEHSADPSLQAMAAQLDDWDGRASTGSTSYLFAREFRQSVLDKIEQGFLAPARARLGERFVEPNRAQLEGTVWPMLSQRPQNLLPAKYSSWDALLDAAAHDAHQRLTDISSSNSLPNWGERNTAAICHPMARALPALLHPWLCMPADPLPGDRNMPRVQGPAFGASERMVVAPGHEHDGIVHMPGGQSDHPLSPFWGAGHQAWVQGRPTPFLPGETRYIVTLQPR